MKTSKLNRIRSYIAVTIGAIAIIGIAAFAPKAEATANNVRYLYRNATFVNERAVERTNTSTRARTDAVKKAEKKAPRAHLFRFHHRRF